MGRIVRIAYEMNLGKRFGIQSPRSYGRSSEVKG
jgi:hypothetical protein